MSRDPLWDALKAASKQGKEERSDENFRNAQDVLSNPNIRILKRHTDYHYTLMSICGNRKVEYWPTKAKWMARGINHRARIGNNMMMKYLINGDISALTAGEVDPNQPELL